MLNLPEISISQLSTVEFRECSHANTWSPNARLSDSYGLDGVLLLLATLNVPLDKKPHNSVGDKASFIYVAAAERS